MLSGLLQPSQTQIKFCNMCTLKITLDCPQKRRQNLIEAVTEVASAVSKGLGWGRAKPTHGPQHLPRLWWISLDHRKALPQGPTPRSRKSLPSPNTRARTHKYTRARMMPGW